MHRMGTTDAKPGFRLPWSADRGESGTPADASGVAAPTGESVTADQQHETPEMIDAASTAPDQATVEDQTASAAPAPAMARRPNKFMADLTKAMQAAAETARADTLARFGAEAKAHIEAIHASTATEASDLRKKADDDVAAIREWSKAEIARIREETDERIAHRKTVLEREIDAHAAEIEARIDRVQRRVAAFESEMDAFFERLLAEEDPTRFAAMAESLPEPPPFDGESSWDMAAGVADQAPATDGPATAESSADDATAAEPDAQAGSDLAGDAVAETTEALSGVEDAQPDPEAAVADDGRADTGDLFGLTAADGSDGDPRLEALGASADFAAAEAEAADFNPEPAATGDEAIPVIADDALAARLAGLVPEAEAGASASTSTRVVVTGLVSVASIAGFKRHLSRVPGVESVGVSSGPDGEFVFTVGHEPSLELEGAVTTLPGFAARVTGSSDGELTVAAHDPESEH
jgi:hypothetical protein